MTKFRFGTVGSPIGKPKSPGGSVGGILYLAELELRALELGWVRSVRVSEKTCIKIKETAEANDVAMSVHAPYYINLNADEDEWPKSRQRLMDAAHYGFLSGATDIIFHPGSYFERLPEEVLPGTIDRLQGCVEELRAAGNTVNLRPETMGKSAMLGSLEDTLQMSTAIEGVEPCVDFPHLHARPGDGSMNTYDEWARNLEIYGKSLGQDALKRMHIHMSGIDYTDKGEKEHLPIEESDLNLEAIFKALLDFDCEGRILCESPILEEDALMMKKRWAEFAGE
ncbi:MAG: TIM barrel protein [Gammaproteobacteria bacterium]|nr:TIM barrel protein [Gammaproteobacteria bacterium]